MTALIIECIALAFLFLCSAFFSSAETALFSLDPIQLHRIRRSRPQSAKRVDKVLASPTQLLSTLLIGNTLVNVVAASLGYAIVARMDLRYAEIISISAMTLLLLVFGEMAPKRLAMRSPEFLSTVYAPLISVLIVLLRPFRFLLDAVTGGLRKYFESHSKTLTEDEFLTAVEVSEEEGVLDEEERTMVDGIIRIADIQASDVMTPRVDLVGIDLDDDPSSYVGAARNAKVRYLPIYRETLDNIDGLLDVSQYLLNPRHDLKEATVQVLYVPETVPLDTLLTTFRKEKCRVAVVADEYGGTAGLVSRGDILEEIVNYFGDEREEEKLTIDQAGKGRWLIDGMTSLEEINYELDLELEAEGADRLAGWIGAVAGHIPRSGESVRAQGCTVTVVRAKKNRVILASLEKTRGDDDTRETE